MPKTNFKVSLKGTSGTVKVGSITSTYSQLVEAFGEPKVCDDKKVCFLWNFTDDEGNVFSIYPWKSTSEFGKHLPTVDKFKENTAPTEFSIGGKGDSSPFKKWLEEKKLGVVD